MQGTCQVFLTIILEMSVAEIDVVIYLMGNWEIILMEVEKISKTNQELIK